MSIFPNSSNPMSMAIAEHYQARDLAIRNLIDLHEAGYDIADRDTFNSVLARYGLLDDGFSSEEDYIIKEILRIGVEI